MGTVQVQYERNFLVRDFLSMATVNVLPYEADAYINQLGYYSVDTDFSIARYTNEYLMKNPTWPTEWKQHSIMMAWADYMYTGNEESLKANYDELKKHKLLMDSARQGGLIDPPHRDITDWPDGERDGFVFKPINAVVNAFYYKKSSANEAIRGSSG